MYDTMVDKAVEANFIYLIGIVSCNLWSIHKVFWKILQIGIVEANFIYLIGIVSGNLWSIHKVFWKILQIGTCNWSSCRLWTWWIYIRIRKEWLILALSFGGSLNTWIIGVCSLKKRPNVTLTIQYQQVSNATTQQLSKTINVNKSNKKSTTSFKQNNY